MGIIPIGLRSTENGLVNFQWCEQAGNEDKLSTSTCGYLIFAAVLTNHPTPWTPCHKDALFVCHIRHMYICSPG